MQQAGPPGFEAGAAAGARPGSPSLLCQTCLRSVLDIRTPVLGMEERHISPAHRMHRPWGQAPLRQSLASEPSPQHYIFLCFGPRCRPRGLQPSG